MFETHEFRSGQIVITDGGLAGIPEGAYVVQQHSGGWSCLVVGDGLHLLGNRDPFASLELALDCVHEAIENDELELASSDRGRAFEPEVFNQIVQRDVASGGNHISSPIERVSIETPLRLILDLFATPETPANLRVRILSLLRTSPIAESLLISEDGSSVCFDEAREVIRVHRRKQETRASLIRGHLEALIKDMTLLVGSAEEERLTAPRLNLDGVPLVESKSLTSGALALGTINTKLLGLLSDVNIAAFECPTVVGDSTAQGLTSTP